jgi:diguanylate cyclase (GGDEF)-like protein
MDDVTDTTLDAFTGLLNRSRLFAILSQAMPIAQESGQPLSLLAFDLDHIRTVNHAHSLIGGDKVILGAARLLASLLGPNQMLFRDGGDQFTIVFFAANAVEAFREADRYRSAVAATPFDIGDGSISITTCVGVAALTPGDSDPEAFFERARDKVHEAKQAGRNRVAH